MWQGLRLATPCRGVVVHHGGRCIMHCGMIRRGEQPGQATLGPICRAAMQSGRGNYLANLILFPGVPNAASMLHGTRCTVGCRTWASMQRGMCCAGRVEFTSFFPENTQGVLVQPIGGDGILIAGTDTQRGFSRLDQVKAPDTSVFQPHSTCTAVDSMKPAECIVDKCTCMHVLARLAQEHWNRVSHICVCPGCRHGSLP